jgi:hypothetical protein
VPNLAAKPHLPATNYAFLMIALLQKKSLLICQTCPISGGGFDMPRKKKVEQQPVQPTQEQQPTTPQLPQ